ncbi:MAG TPA: glycosyltransferase [Actinomycetota bacterium]
MKKKRILILIKGLGRGGAEQLLVSAAPYFDRDRFEYEVAYLLPWKDAFVKELERLGLRVSCLEGGSGSVGWMWRLRRFIRERRVDLVHSHSPVAAVGARLVGGPGLGRVYTEHNVWERYHPVTYWLNALSFPRNDQVFAVSDRVRLSIGYPRSLRFLPMPKLETLYHGLDPAAVARWAGGDGVREELGIPDDAPIVGTVANFKHHKGYEDLLRAASLVRRAIPDVRFVLVGRGPLEEEVRRQALDLGLSGTVVFAGYREDAPRLAQAFDVFALASVHEGLSIALIEAMAMGTPAVVTNVGGIPEVVEQGKQGILVPPRDPGAMAHGITTVLRDAPLRERLGAEARLRAATFDIRKAVTRMEQVYEELG